MCRFCGLTETRQGNAPDEETAARFAGVLNALAEGRACEVESLDLIEFSETYDRAARDVRPVTRACYEKAARLYLKPLIGAVPLARLTPLLLQDKFDELKARGLKPLTVYNVRGLPSGALRYAVKLGLLPSNPVAVIETPKAKRRPGPAMDEAEAARFIEAAREDPHGLMFTLWLYVGLRPAEFLGLRRPDVGLAGEGAHAYGSCASGRRLYGWPVRAGTFASRRRRRASAPSTSPRGSTPI